MNQEQRAALRKMAEDATSDTQIILQLLDYIETLERDARRYRWLRKYFVSDDTSLDEKIVDASDCIENLNAVIDAAMGETE